MSHTIYFYQKRALDQRTFLGILEEDKASAKGEISVKDFLELKDLIKQGQDKKLMSASRDELSFENFQINRYEHYISFSIPYWEKNYQDKEVLNLWAVLDVFIGKGYGGYDPQVELFILEEAYSFYNMYRQCAAVVLGK
ncbi:MAG: hypothetical protein AAFV25_20990 [Bacteroidota bacterium]